MFGNGHAASEPRPAVFDWRVVVLTETTNGPSSITDQAKSLRDTLVMQGMLSLLSSSPPAAF